MQVLAVVSGAFALLSLAFLGLARSAYRKRRWLGTASRSGGAALSLSLAALAATLAVSTQGYRALTREEVAATVTTLPTGPASFQAFVEFPDGRDTTLAVRGEQLLVDAHILKWRYVGNVLGLHTQYELDRLTGRYLNVDDERTRPRTVHSLKSAKPVDLFDLVERFSFLTGLVDAEYGSATYIEVDQPARFEIRVSTTGLLVREIELRYGVASQDGSVPHGGRLASTSLRSAVRLSTAALAMLGVAYLAGVALKKPSLNRNWDEDVAVLAGVEADTDGRIHLSDVRDWRYTRDSVVTKGYFDRTYDPADIVGLWLYEQPLDGVGLIAHTFLVFEFDPSYGPDRWLGLSVETRRESDEVYSIVLGMLRKFEVTHIWASEEDLVRRRVEYLDYPLRRYRLDIPVSYQTRIFAKMTQETQALSESPRWYHTALYNCTSSLIRYVNESEPDAIPLHYSYVFTGKIDEYLEQLGYLDRAAGTDITRDFLDDGPLR